MKGVDTIARILRGFFVRGKMIKEIVRELHVSRNTVRKVLRSSATEFTYQREVQPLPKLPFVIGRSTCPVPIYMLLSCSTIERQDQGGRGSVERSCYAFDLRGTTSASTLVRSASILAPNRSVAARSGWSARWA